MAKNLRKGSHVLISVSGRGFKNTEGIVQSTNGDDIIIRVTSGFAKGKLLVRKPREVKRR